MVAIPGFSKPRLVVDDHAINSRSVCFGFSSEDVHSSRLMRTREFSQVEAHQPALILTYYR